MYGCHDWADAYVDRKAQILTASELRFELVNLMGWRIEITRSYKITHSFDLKNTKGVPIYTMLFATDNDAGNAIMSSIYRKAAERQPAMRAEAVAAKLAQKEEELGIGGLFAPMPKMVPANAKIEYVHAPPRLPYRRSTQAS